MRSRSWVVVTGSAIVVLVMCAHRTEAGALQRGLFDDLQALFNKNKTKENETSAATTEAPDISKCEETCQNKFAACGVPNRGTRVVGGRPSRINEYPWAVALTYRGRFYCGGSLINDRYVLTAAHCINGLNHNRVEVTLGEHDRNLPFEAITRKIKVLWWLKHPEFNPKTFNNDIALVRMKESVSFSRIMRPVCLPRPGYNYTGEKVTVVGWGRTSEGGSTANLLQEVLLPVFSNAECRALKYDAEEITSNMMCAGYTQGKIDACQGDSGGPMHWQAKDGKTNIIGIVSWGQGCGRPGLPGVYTRVSNYLDWIEHNTPDSCYCGRRTPRRRRHAPQSARANSARFVMRGTSHSEDNAGGAGRARRAATQQDLNARSHRRS